MDIKNLYNISKKYFDIKNRILHYCKIHLGVFADAQLMLLKRFADIGQPPTTNLVRIVGPETNVFIGDKMLFTCMYEKFQIAREARWAFKYKNGTIDFFEVGKF